MHEQGTYEFFYIIIKSVRSDAWPKIPRWKNSGTNQRGAVCLRDLLLDYTWHFPFSHQKNRKSTIKNCVKVNQKCVYVGFFFLIATALVNHRNINLISEVLISHLFGIVVIIKNSMIYVHRISYFIWIVA